MTKLIDIYVDCHNVHFPPATLLITKVFPRFLYYAYCQLKMRTDTLSSFSFNPSTISNLQTSDFVWTTQLEVFSEIGKQVEEAQCASRCVAFVAFVKRSKWTIITKKIKPFAYIGFKFQLILRKTFIRCINKLRDGHHWIWCYCTIYLGNCSKYFFSSLIFLSIFFLLLSFKMWNNNLITHCQQKTISQHHLGNHLPFSSTESRNKTTARKRQTTHKRLYYFKLNKKKTVWYALRLDDVLFRISALFSSSTNDVDSTEFRSKF